MSQVSGASILRELKNPQRTVLYSGEAIEQSDNESFQLRGQGKLETIGYLGRYDMFNGRFISNKRQGQASLSKRDADGNLILGFEGVFVEDMPEGQGQLTLYNTLMDLDQPSLDPSKQQVARKRVFQGQFKDGLMDGFGQLDCPNRFNYSGQWLKGKPHGQGQCTYSDIDVTYSGQWENGMKHGQGELIWLKTGYKMQATFKEDQLEGPGSRSYTSGKSITGIWSENLLITGKLSNIDGTTYEGDWVGGRPHGNGVKVISGGKRYEGMFSVGRPWGVGSKVSGDRREDGYWDKAKFTSGEAPEGKVADFNEQLQSIKTYFKVFKKFHAKDLPKTNYDCIHEERSEMEGIAEFELMDRLAKSYHNQLCQDYKLEKEFEISEVGLTIAGAPSSRQLTGVKQGEQSEHNMSKPDLNQDEETRNNNARNGQKTMPTVIKQASNESLGQQDDTNGLPQTVTETPGLPRGLVMAKNQSELSKHKQSRFSNMKMSGIATEAKYREQDSVERADDASTSNYSAIKLGLQGLRNDEATEDSIVTETDLGTLNTGKIMAAMIKKGDLQMINNQDGLNGTRIMEPHEIIDERDEDDIDPMSQPMIREGQAKSIENSFIRITEQRIGNVAATVNPMSTSSPELEKVRPTGHFHETIVTKASIKGELLNKKTSKTHSEYPPNESMKSSTINKGTDQTLTGRIAGHGSNVDCAESTIQTQLGQRRPSGKIANDQQQIPPGMNEAMVKTITQSSMRSIKEVRRQGNPDHFDFERVNTDTNEETIQRVLAFIRDKPSSVSKLADGSVYHGAKIDKKPNGTGFVAVYDCSNLDTLEQVYLGHFEQGKASKFGYLIFDRGEGRYTGEWYLGKYHGKGTFKREWPSKNLPGELETQLYDGYWQHGDMSGFGTFKWPSGNMYEGEWLANRRHGEGKLLDNLGRLRKIGRWQMGKYVNEGQQNV